MSTDRLTEVLNYLSAMSRDIGELRTEVRTGFEQVRSDIRHLKHKLEVLTEDSMELRTDQRDLRKRVEVLERKAGITDSV
jgi:hypothetical protein